MAVFSPHLNTGGGVFNTLWIQEPHDGRETEAREGRAHSFINTYLTLLRNTHTWKDNAITFQVYSIIDLLLRAK